MIPLEDWRKKMYLSRAALDVTNRETMRALAAPSRFHGALESTFEGERKRNLWRLDRLRGKQYILILSEDKPELSGFCEQFSMSSGDWESRSYDAFLSKIEDGSKWRFRLTANPTRSEKKDGARGKVYAHKTPEHQKEWLMRKAETNGFKLSTDSFDVTESKWYRFNKKNRKNVTLLSVTYEGVLEVSDAEKFREALSSGIGRGKAYGMGLMTIM